MLTRKEPGAGVIQPTGSRRIVKVLRAYRLSHKENCAPKMPSSIVEMHERAKGGRSARRNPNVGHEVDVVTDLPIDGLADQMRVA